MTMHSYEHCPQCEKGRIETGFGLAGGGYGPYQYCDTCDFFVKFQEHDDGEVDPKPVDPPDDTPARPAPAETEGRDDG